MKRFSSFVTTKDRENKENLHVLQQVLEKAGFQVSNNLDNPKEPYIYVHKPTDVDSVLESLSFGGVRLYTRGTDIICYRAQNKEKTEPFGESRILDIKGMFKDLIRDSSREKIGHKIIFQVIKELKDFFIRSAEAEKENDVGDGEMGTAVIGGVSNDYSTTVFNDISTKR